MNVHFSNSGRLFDSSLSMSTCIPGDSRVYPLGIWHTPGLFKIPQTFQSLFNKILLLLINGMLPNIASISDEVM